MHLRRLIPLFVGCTLPALMGAEAVPLAVNWSSNIFTKDNFRSMSVRGAKASFPTSSNEVEVVDFDLTAFSGDASKKIETVIRAPAATFLPRQNLARGETGVHLIRDDLEASGIHWVYDHAQKKVSLTGHVRIVFNAEFKTLLK